MAFSLKRLSQSWQSVIVNFTVYIVITKALRVGKVCTVLLLVTIHEIAVKLLHCCNGSALHWYYELICQN